MYKREIREQDQAVHGSFLPFDVRPGEAISCAVRQSGEDTALPFEVWRLSPFGLECVDKEPSAVARGTRVDVVLRVGGSAMEYKGSVVSVGRVENGKKLFGVRLDTSPKSERKGEDVDQRGKMRWQCHRLFYPTGVAVNKARFSDKIYFRVTDISASGLRICTSMRNKHMTLGTELDARVQLPSVGDFPVRLRVMHLDVKVIDGQEAQYVGVKMLHPDRQCLAHLGQYILQFGGDDKASPTPRQLAQQGFSVHSIADAIEYDLVRTDEEYQQVLQLRSLAFQGVEGLGVNASPEQMADVYDARSRILICRYRGKVVATTRLCFHNTGDEFEEEKYVKFPDDFPPRHLVVEASRAATHPDFRGNDLFLNIFRYVMLVTLQSGRRWIVQSTYAKLVPVYEKVGFRQTGLRCPHPVFPGEDLHLLLGDCQSVLDGRVGNLLTWNTLVPDIHHLLDNNDTIHLSWVAKKRLSLYQALNPLYRYYEKKKIARRMKRRF